MKTYNLDNKDDLNKLPKEALVSIIKDLLTEKSEINNQLGCPVEVVLQALKQDYICIGKQQKQISISLYLDDDGNFAFDGEYKLKDHKKTWWTKEDLSE